MLKIIGANILNYFLGFLAVIGVIFYGLANENWKAYVLSVIALIVIATIVASIVVHNQELKNKILIGSLIINAVVVMILVIIPFISSILKK